MVLKYERWGNNEYHYPKFCEDCESDSCLVCSNGPKGRQYKIAMGEERIKDAEYEASQWNGLDE